jgi:hypothetical protein
MELNKNKNKKLSIHKIRIIYYSQMIKINNFNKIIISKK